jgi:hypothetical protein
VSATRAQRTARARRFVRAFERRAASVWAACGRLTRVESGAVVALRHLLRVPQGELRERIWDLLAVLEGREVPR